jgi:isocitrate dehydrogenase kinase/phosphatase
MTQSVTISRQANEVGRLIFGAFEEFQSEFMEITRRASLRFKTRDWHGMQNDSGQRLDVYSSIVGRAAQRIIQLLGPRRENRLLWVSIKAVYSGRIIDRDDWEIAETFFNSVTRRIFNTVGVDNQIEFVHTDYDVPPTPAREKVYRSYPDCTTVAQWKRVLADFNLPMDEDSLEREARLAASTVQSRLRPKGQSAPLAVEMVGSVFYRGEYAYLVGRLVMGEWRLPLVICLSHPEGGPRVDAVLMHENDVSLLFSFARSYFLVEVTRPYELVRFINTIIPRKRAAEIYISIGYNKHGKTELYRNALRHLARSTDKYELARGQRGMVMVVFTMPSYGVVFKIIKDRFDYPKSCTREEVIARYDLVFMHDRAGRLIDAQEYRYLELDRNRFSNELLDELLVVASQTVSVRGDKVVIKHCYAERRVVPLNIFLREAPKAAAEEAVIDFGNTIRDLARTNIFPGDLLLKNFGVTRHGRVVFYDYDEISLLTGCNIRELPQSDDYDEEMAAEPWYGVGPQDMFPEEFGHFLGLQPALREVFMIYHADLLGVPFWRDLQQQLRDGTLYHIAPYGNDTRLSRPGESENLAS